MKKTISVTLNGFAYTLDEDAYGKLKKYLDGIRDYFESSDSAETSNEIIADIEASIAEKFSAKLGPKKQVISYNDIKELIKVMGTIEDIAGSQGALSEKNKNEDKKKEDDESGRVGKKLYRDTDDVIIAGVASGIAKYFGIETVLVRLIFAALIFAGGTGIWLYLILWLIMPKASTSSQKLEMQGEPVTLKELENLAREKAQEIKNMDKRKVTGFFNSIFRFFGEFFKVLGKLLMRFGSIIRILLGLPIVIFSILTMTSIGFALFAIVFNIDSPMVNMPFPITDVISANLLPIAAIALFFVAFVPLLFLLLLGTSLISGKSEFSGAASMLFIGIWMIAVITSGVIAVDVAPRVEEQVEACSANVDSEMISRDLEFKDFNRLDISNALEVHVVPGDEHHVTVTGRESDMKYLDVQVRGGELIARQKIERICLFCSPQKMRLDISSPELTQIKSSGASSVTAQGFDGDKIDISITGASRGEFKLDFKELYLDVNGVSNVSLESASSSKVDINISGASKVELVGAAQELKINESGASTISASDFISDEVEVDIEGASTAKVNSTQKLKVEASGMSTVYYLGNPEIEDRLDASGNLIKID